MGSVQRAERRGRFEPMSFAPGLPAGRRTPLALPYSKARKQRAMNGRIANRVAACILLGLVACTSRSPNGRSAVAAVSRAVEARAAQCGAGSPDGPALVPPLAERHLRADRAIESLLVHYWRGADGYFSAAHPHAGGLTGYWTFAQAFDAVLDGVERTSGRRFSGTVETLYLAQDARGWRRNYFDDESWMALALIRASDQFGDPRYLSRARQLLDGIIADAWDTQSCVVAGNYWDRAHTQKATAANAGPVIAAIRLSERTGETRYFDFARQLYDAWRAAMVDPTTYAVTDHVDCRTGQRVYYRFTYNEGLMIGAAVELYRVTQDPAFLEDARGMAGYLAEFETQPGATGPVLFDGTSARCTGDCAQFKGIGYRYLMALLAADPGNDRVQAILDASARSIWDVARDPARDLFGTDWIAAPQASIRIDAQSSAAMALNLHAELAGPPPDGPPLEVFEAEEAVLHGVELENTHGAFTGFGYVAGWNADGQWIDFHPSVDLAERRRLRFRYAAGAGDAYRLIYLNGRNVIDRQRFVSTGSWDDYRTVEIEVPLVAGDNAVSVIYNGGLQSAGHLNLDHLELVAGP